MQVTNRKLSRFSETPSADVVEMYVNQQAECVSWCESNCLMRACCALNARMVGRPSKETAKWVNTGDLADADEIFRE